LILFSAAACLFAQNFLWSPGGLTLSSPVPLCPTWCTQFQQLHGQANQQVQVASQGQQLLKLLSQNQTLTWTLLGLCQSYYDNSYIKMTAFKSRMTSQNFAFGRGDFRLVQLFCQFLSGQVPKLHFDTSGLLHAQGFRSFQTL
jgi:hypothetical protein